MKVTVKYWGQVKQAAGTSSETVELEDDATIQSLLIVLTERHGDSLLRHLLDDTGRPRTSLLVVIGDEQIDARTSRPLKEGDSVTLLPPIAGGAP